MSAVSSICALLRAPVVRAMACWDKITAPILVVVGGESTFQELAGAAAGTEEASVFATAERVVAANSGHMVHFEQPEMLAAAVEKFIIV